MIKKVKVYNHSRNMNLGTLDSFGAGVKNDNEVDKIYFEFDEMVESQATLLTTLKDNDGEYYAFPLTHETNGYSIEITNTMLVQPSYDIQLMITDDDKVWHSNKYTIHVNPCLDAGTGTMPSALDIWITEIEDKINECDNLNISASKSGTTTTISITDKEGTTTDTEILDGVGLNYNWSGTSLGIKREDESDYSYTDLKGDKGDAGAIKMLIVNELPQTGADDTIYLVPITGETENNYEEYIYVNGGWEKLGGIQVQVDLTDYVKNTDYASSSVGGVFKIGNSYGTTIYNGYLSGVGRTYANYSSDSNALIICKGTLENVITGKDLTTKSYVDGLVGDISSTLDAINGEVV